MIVAVANVKGGTGKTTIATNLAIFRAQSSSDVLLVDSDAQKSATDFANVREEEGHEPQITCASMNGQSLKSEIRKMEPKFDDIVIDVGGRDSPTLRSALLVADVLVIPFLPSQLDAWSIQQMDTLVGEVKTLNENLRTIVCLNKTDTNPRIGLTDDAEIFTKELQNLNYNNLKVGNRVSFRRSVADGQSVNEITRKDIKAEQEIMDIYKEVFKDA